MHRSSPVGTRLRIESLESRSMLSAAASTAFSRLPDFVVLGPPAPPGIVDSVSHQAASSVPARVAGQESRVLPNPFASLVLTTVPVSSGTFQLQPTSQVSTSVMIPQTGDLLSSALQDLQAIGQLAEAVASDPEITGSMTTDVASLIGAVNQVVNNVGNGSLDAGAAIQIGVTSTANPQAAAVLNSLLTDVANDLQSLNVTADNVGTAVSGTLSDPIRAGLSQINNVLVGLDLLTGGASGGVGGGLLQLENSFAENELVAASEINGLLQTAFGQAPSLVIDGLAINDPTINGLPVNGLTINDLLSTTNNLETTAGSVGLISAAAQNVTGVPDVAVAALGQPLALTTAGTSPLQDVNGLAVDPFASQSLALATAGTTSLQDVNDQALNPFASQPLALTTAGTTSLQDVNDQAVNPFAVASGEFETVGVPTDLSNSLLTDTQSISTDLSNLDAGDSTYVDQTVDTTLITSLGE